MAVSRKKTVNMNDSVGEKIRKFLFPKTSDEIFNRDMALGHGVVVAYDDGSDPFPFQVREPIPIDTETMAKLAGLAHAARVACDKQRGETDEE